MAFGICGSAVSLPVCDCWRGGGSEQRPALSLLYMQSSETTGRNCILAGKLEEGIANKAERDHANIAAGESQ